MEKVFLFTTINISIHAPREGGDECVWCDENNRNISIHAPREGGDTTAAPLRPDAVLHFNPRPPRGGRPEQTRNKSARRKFQSTPPARGATQNEYTGVQVGDVFQSTPPARGATQIPRQLLLE